MDALNDDLKDLLLLLSDCAKSGRACTRTNNELKAMLQITNERLKVSQESEERMRLKLQKNQENLTDLQNVLNGYINIKEENEMLKMEIKKIQELLEIEKKNYAAEKEKWTVEKDNIIKTNREEIENLKKIRNMEVSSLNREITNIHKDNDRKIELIKNEIENDYKNQLSRTILNYEEKMTKLSRDLISTQSELRNLRQATEENLHTNTVENRRAMRDRYIPQPLSYARYKPIVPIVSTASQMYNPTTDEQEAEKSPAIAPEINTPQVKKKRKLYTRNDDFL